MKSRIRKAEKIAKKWRDLLLIDAKWKIEFSYLAEPDEEDTYAETDLSCGEYYINKILLCPKLMDLPAEKFEEQIEETVVHELLHLIQWPMGSYIWNMTGTKDCRESKKVEEVVVTHLEKVVIGLWRQLCAKKAGVQVQTAPQASPIP